MPERAHGLQQKAIENGLLASGTERRLAVAVGTDHTGAQVQAVRAGAAERMVRRLDDRLAVHRPIELVRRNRLAAAVQLSFEVVERRLLAAGQVLVQTVVQVVDERTAARR